MITIESGIPLPKQKKQAIYPLSEMKIGDSFLVACGENEKARTKNTLFSCFRQYSIKHDNKAKFVSRRVDGGIRVWRTE